jgi:hypothetical protein
MVRARFTVRNKVRISRIFDGYLEFVLWEEGDRRSLLCL